MPVLAPADQTTKKSLSLGARPGGRRVSPILYKAGVTAAAERIKSRLDREDLPQGSMRRRVLESARRFKSSWVELGCLLSEVKRDGLWREWGYPSFEAYCSKELFIRKQTAEKLTASYGFLSRHEPSLVREDGDRPTPPFEVIEVLSRAEAAGRLPEDGWREMREEIFERPPTPAALNRQLTDRFGPASRPEPPSDEERLRRLASLARRLASACASDSAVPSALAERARALADDFDEIFEG